MRLPSFGLCALIALCLTLLASGTALAETAANPRSAVLLLKASSGQGTETSFGRGHTVGSASRAIREPFEAAGFKFLATDNLTPPVGDAPSGLPLSDSAALHMAREAGASICVVVGITAKAKGKIRATKLVSHEAKLRLRVLVVGSGEVVANLSASRFGYGPSTSQSVSAAMASALAAVAKEVASPLRKRWPTPSASGASAISLTINGATGWRPIASILKQLAASKGIKFVHALEIGSSQVRLSVSSAMSAGSLVSILRRTRIANGTLSVVTSGNTITVSLRMAVATSPINHG